MSPIDDHRKITATNETCISLIQPFSCFNFIESVFGDYDSIRRLFSLARSSLAKTLVCEKIPACGIIAEENEDILALFGGYKNTDLVRLSFWKSEFDTTSASLSVADIVGYAILKKDEIASLGEMWHVFESVFIKYPHQHNCVPCPGHYELKVGQEIYLVDGVLYCQQNGLNKACAQVALRSILSRLIPEEDISYRKINNIANSVMAGFSPGKGLNVSQIREILNSYGIKFRDIDYTLSSPEMRNALPYQKFAYAGLEGGAAALVGFRLSGRNLEEEAKHIIPIYGHTFNKDTWAPDADFSYFRIGEGLGYVPSECWTSSFLGHDDNFGPNFCIPRLYIEKEKVDYAVEIFREGVCYSGVQAEAMALNLLYSLLPQLSLNGNTWIARLLEWVSKQQIVFRTISIQAEDYVDHLVSIVDWDGNTEDESIYRSFEDDLPEYLWVIEISTPQLFPANERKLGDIVFDATQELNTSDEEAMNNVFILARLPEAYFFGGDMADGTPEFTTIVSGIESHTDLIKQ